MCNITKITYFQALVKNISFFSDRSLEKNTFNISWNFNNFKLKIFNIYLKNFIKNFIKIYETFENIKKLLL